MSDIAVLAVVGVIIGLSISRGIKMKKEGCGGCGSCPYSHSCDKKKEK